MKIPFPIYDRSRAVRAAAVILLALAATGCGLFGNKTAEEKDSDIGKQEYQTEKNPVDTMILRRTTFMSQLVSNGKLRAATKSSVRFASPGVVVELPVRNGSVVRAGDVIAVIDKREAEISLERAESQFDKAVLALENALLDFGYTAAQRDNVPEETMRIARTKSGYDDALLALRSARNSLDNCTLRAPVGGNIADLNTKLHEYPSGNEFCKVLDNNTFEVEFPVLETEIGQVRVGQSILMSTFTDPGERFSGSVTEINPMVNDKGQILVKAEFRNPGDFLDGMNVKVFVENAIQGKLVVPKNAVLIRDNLEVLFLYDNGKALWTYVNVQMTNSTQCVVVANEDRQASLKEGDVVITSGNLTLANGSNVEIK